MKRLLNTKNIQISCHHLHIDKSNTITKDLLSQSQVHMQNKWFLMRDIKENYTSSNLIERMLATTKNIVDQGCDKMRTFIDVDHIIKLVGYTHYCSRQIRYKNKKQP